MSKESRCRRTVGIVGLGLIGGSLAKAIRNKYDDIILGADTYEATIKQAFDSGCIDDVLTDENISQCDLILIALYPQAVIDYVREKAVLLQKEAVVIDCAGVKGRICSELFGVADENDFYFIGGHPMAGVERSGFASSFKELFEGASMILCRGEAMSGDVFEDVSRYFTGIGFGSVTETTAKTHDRIIAYTSQLAHIASSAYIKSPTLRERYGFSAGSYKDLTRVAKLNPDMWAELFLENRDNLINEINSLILELKKYRDTLAEGDEACLKALLADGSILKQEDEER